MRIGKKEMFHLKDTSHPFKLSLQVSCAVQHSSIPILLHQFQNDGQYDTTSTSVDRTVIYRDEGFGNDPERY